MCVFFCSNLSCNSPVHSPVRYYHLLDVGTSLPLLHKPLLLELLQARIAVATKHFGLSPVILLSRQHSQQTALSYFTIAAATKKPKEGTLEKKREKRSKFFLAFLVHVAHVTSAVLPRLL